MSQLLYIVEVLHPKASGFFTQVRADGTYELNPRPYAKLMTLVYARLLVERLTEKKCRARILDQYGNAVTEFTDSSLPQEEPLTLQTNHVASVYREVFNGKHIEIPLLLNRSLRTYFFKFTTSSNLNDPPDISISGSTPQEVFERFTQNPHLQRYIERFVVDPIVPAAAATEPQPIIPPISVPQGFTLVGLRPGSAR